MRAPKSQKLWKPNLQVAKVEIAGMGVRKMKFCIKCLRQVKSCLLYTSPSPRDRTRSRMPSSA